MEGIKAVLYVLSKAKPVLLKLFPHTFLRQMKQRIVKNSFKKMEKVSIEPFCREKYKDGINLIGNIKAETGLGQSCRLVAKELEESGIPYSLYQYNQL